MHNVLRRCVLIRPVAVSISAGNKKHRYRSNARYEKRIMIGAADHVLEAEPVFLARTNRAPRLCRGHIRQARLHSACQCAQRPRVSSRFSAKLRSIAPMTLSRRARSVSRTSRLRRTRLGMLFTAPGKTSHIPTVATVSIDPLDRAAFSTARINSDAAQRASRRSGIRTPPACPPEPSIEMRALAGAAIFVTMSKVNVFTFQHRPLFDVHFDECLVIAGRQSDFFEFAAHARRAAELRRPIFRRCRAVCEQHPQKGCPRASRLPRHPIPKRVGSSEVKSNELNRIFWPESGRVAVRVWPRDLRALPRRHRTFRHWESRRCASRYRQPALRLRAVPARERISDGIQPDREAGLLAPLDEPRASLQVGGREDDSCYRGRFRIRNRSERLDFGRQSRGINCDESSIDV